MPRYNVSIAFLSLYLHTSKVFGVRGGGEGQKVFYFGFIMTTLVSILVDLDWLVSQDRPIPLEGVEEFSGYRNPGGNQGNIYEESNKMQGLATVCRVALVGNIFLKLLICYSVVSKTKVGLKLLKVAFFKPMKYFLPTINMPRAGKMKNSIAKRLIANAWIQFACTACMFSVSLVAMTAMSSHPHFLNDSAGVPLTILMLFKGFSNLMVFLSILRNTDIGDFLNEFGCLITCKSWYKGRKKRLSNKRGFKAPKIFVDEEYISSVRGVKLFDFCVGLWVWIGLIHALQFGGGRATKGIRILTGLSVTSMILSDIVVVLNLAVVGWYVRVVENRRRRRRMMDDDDDESTSEEEEGEDEDNDESGSDSDDSDGSAGGGVEVEGGGAEGASSRRSSGPLLSSTGRGWKEWTEQREVEEVEEDSGSSAQPATLNIDELELELQAT